MREVRIPGLRRVLRIPRLSRDVGRDVAEEIRFHLDARIEELMRMGVPAADAHERARLEYGDIEASHRELTRVDRRRAGRERHRELLMSMRDDLWYSVRSLARRPSLLVVTTLTLGVGIAANAIMFGVVDQLLLRPPAHVAAPERVKRIFIRSVERGETRTTAVTTYPTLTALRAQAPAFAELAAYGRPNEFSLGRGRDAQNVSAQLVSGNYFRLLGVPAALGRTFVDDDDRVPDGNDVAIISDGLWRRQFGGEPSAIGRTLLLQGRTFTIVGVAPRGFSGIDLQKVDVWLPISAIANETIGRGWHNKRNSWWAQIIGRVRPEATVDLATEQATRGYRAFLREWKERSPDSSSIVLSQIVATHKPDGLSREARVSLWLLGVSGVVLLIACANVANLLIARTLERCREIAVRLALGAGRGRLLRLLLTEAGVLAILGSVTALAIAYGTSRLVQNVLLPQVVWSESVIDVRIFVFTLGATLICLLLAGVAPALQGMRTSVGEGLKVSARQVTGGRGGLRFVLLLTQAALSVILLVGAGLFVRSLRNVVMRDVGVDRDRVLRVTMPLARFGFDSLQIEDIYRRGAERVRSIPGVTNAAVARLTYPLGSASANGFSVPGVERIDLPGGGPYNSVVTSGFFSTIGARIILGRDFTPAEERLPSRVVIVNQAIANAYWPNTSAIGKCVKIGRDSTCSEVIGVVGNVLQFSLVGDDRAIVYAPPGHPAAAGADPGAMLIRVAADRAVIPLVRSELQALAPTMPFVDVKAYSELVAWQLQPWRLGATMFTVFGLLALAIAAVGLYSVMAYWVSQRTHEIGVRMALGAQRWDVVRLVAFQSSRAVIAGVIVGGGVALFASPWIADLLYQTSPREPAVYIGAAVVISLAAVVASIVPARRSTSVDPVQAIKSD